MQFKTPRAVYRDSPRYRPEIDGLRALAVLPVILFHSGIALFSGGYVGVDVFFVISGFLITGILAEDFQTGRFSVLAFYERRARRILPAVIFVICTSIPIAWLVLLPGDLAHFGDSVLAAATFSSNFYFWHESDYFATAASLQPLLHTWSLAVEEQFYILFPLFLFVAMTWLRRWLIPLLVLIFLSSLLIAQVGSSIKPVASFYLLPTRSYELMIGAIAAIYLRGDPVRYPARVNEALSLAGLAAIVIAVFIYRETLPFPGSYALLPTLGTALILLFAKPNALVTRLLSTKVLVGLGLISYSAYLWHQPLIAFYNYRFMDRPEGVLIAAAISIPIAWVSWRFVEMPFREKRVLKTRSSVLLASVFSLSAVAAIGALLPLDEGFKKRFDPLEQRVFAELAEGPAYVPARFNSLRLKAFERNSNKRKILIIGDSYGQDLVNALFEGGFNDFLDLSTYHITKVCGNLLVDRDLSKFWDVQWVENCRRHQRYNNTDLRKRMTEADEIWLVSAWAPWVADLLPESLDNLKKLTPAKLVVFGRKDLGDREPRAFYHGGLGALLGREAVSAPYVLVQDQMAQTIPEAGVEFVDLQLLLCESHRFCSNATRDGLPISFDGAHLTRAGARLAGARLDALLAVPARHASLN